MRLYRTHPPSCDEYLCPEVLGAAHTGTPIREQNKAKIYTVVQHYRWLSEILAWQYVTTQVYSLVSSLPRFRGYIFRYCDLNSHISRETFLQDDFTTLYDRFVDMVLRQECIYPSRTSATTIPVESFWYYLACNEQ